jgi:hypothetical protein
MKSRLVVGVALACGLTAIGNPFIDATRVVVAAQNEHDDCSHLVRLQLRDVKISEAVTASAATTGAVRARMWTAAPR